MAKLVRAEMGTNVYYATITDEQYQLFLEDEEKFWDEVSEDDIEWNRYWEKWPYEPEYWVEEE